jgi:hypothetical protein
MNNLRDGPVFRLVERTRSWLNRFRRLLVRWEKREDTYLAMLQFVCGLIAWRSALSKYAVRNGQTPVFTQAASMAKCRFLSCVVCHTDFVIVNYAAEADGDFVWRIGRTRPSSAIRLGSQKNIRMAVRPLLRTFDH